MNDQNNNYYNPGVYTQQLPQQVQPQQPVPQQVPMQQQPMVPQQQPYQGQQVPMPNFGQGMQSPPQTPGHPPMLQQIPQYHKPDEQALVNAYQQHRMSMGAGFNFVKFPGPNGEEKWGNVPINYTSMVRVYLLPPWAAGKNIFAISRSHFWKSASSPQGRSIGCPGSELCKICQGKVQALDSGNPSLQKKAKDFGKIRIQYLYQVAMLDQIDRHFVSGQGVPYVLGAGSNLHSDIGNLIEDKSISIFDPQQGRPLRLKKTKTGSLPMDVEYKCSDEDPSPLPQVLWSLLNNLIDLEHVNRMPTEEEMVEAVQDMGLVVSSYGGPNPYNVQTPVAQQPQQVMPTVTPAMPPPQPMLPNIVQPVGPPPMQPPPVTSDNSNQGYAPQPSQQSQQVPQNPVNPGIVRQPIAAPKEENEAPQTLEQLQQSVRGK